jgi:hypothetical protein
MLRYVSFTSSQSHDLGKSEREICCGNVEVFSLAENRVRLLGSEVLTPVVIKSSVLWDTMSCQVTRRALPATCFHAVFFT